MISLNELENEKKYLSEVQSVTKELIREKNKVIEERKKDVVASKKHLWQNMNEYTGPEMHSKMNDEDLNVLLINREILKTARLERSLDSSFFGKVIFKTNESSESIYVGITGIEKDYNNYVFDWRAPISNLYYNFELGNAYYDTPRGKVSGEITSKRQFKIELGELKNAFDTDVTLEDEMLQDVLLSSSDDKMKNIVSTIQKEQNEVIRYGGKKDLVIEGVAGSGKTSVAMHRIAYLLYREKGLTNKNVLIFSPNDIFTSYISNVLPELGEENVDAITFEELLLKFIPNVRAETIREFIERFYENKTNEEDVKLKFSEEYMDRIDAYIKNVSNSLTFKSKIGLKKKFIESEELNKIFASVKKLSLNDRVYYLADKLCDLYDIDIDKNTDKFASIIRHMLGLDKNILEFYREFLGDDDFAKDNLIPYEDIGGILYMYFEINGYPRLSHIKHVIIDEAQDYTILEFKLLKRIFNSASFTVLGDKNQAINPYLKYNSLEELIDVFDSGKYERLLKTYRSSKEIIEFSNSILGINDIKSVRHAMNREVIFKSGDDLNSDIKEFMSEFKRIAIITKTMDETDKLYEKLNSKTVGLMTDSILKPVVIGPVYIAKGLEFDAVIVYTDVDDKFSESESNLYYIAATRAQHALTIYNQK